MICYQNYLRTSTIASEIKVVGGFVGHSDDGMSIFPKYNFVSLNGNSLHSNSLSDTILRLLKQLDTVKEVQLKYLVITESHADIISSMKSIKTLNLEHVQISEKAIELLRENIQNVNVKRVALVGDSLPG